jgi:hypothetical protein
MAARNYQPSLRRIARLLNLFMVRYQAQILAGMTAPQAVAFAAAEASLGELLAELGDGGGV